MKKFRKVIVAVLAAVLCLGVAATFTGCKKEKNVFTILGLKGGRGEQYINNLVTEFKKTYDGEVKVIMEPSANIESELTRMINAGNYPDLIVLNSNMPNGSVEKLVQSKNLVDLSDMLNETVAGEDAKLGGKLIDGILNNYSTQPYGDGKTYMLPAFYSPTGLFYDASRFGENKYALPSTWTEFFALGEQLKTAAGGTYTADKPALFTYPTTGYFDSIFYATVATMAGDTKYNEMLGYKDGIFEDADVKAALTKIVELKKYLLPTTPGNANKENFTKNQQAVIGTSDGSAKGTALFLPNGDWLPGEMNQSTPKGFEWGFMPMPAKETDGTRYTTTFIETLMIHKKGGFTQAAKDFVKLYYSDKGAEIVAKANGAIIPTKSALANAAANGVDPATIELYEIYNTPNTKAVVGNFIATDPVPDLVWADVLFNDLNERVFATGVTDSTETLVNAWAARLESAGDQLRGKIIK